MHYKNLITFAVMMALIGFSSCADYDYFEQGEDWEDTCATGTIQSPIDFNTSETITLDNYWIYFGFSPVTDSTVTMPGTTLKATYYDGRAILNEDGVLSEWETLQFHFHAPGEHTEDTITYDSEVHIVFQRMDGSGELLVLGRWLDGNTT